MGIRRAWIALALAVLAPAAALCWLQFRSLSDLEEKTRAAVRDSLRRQLELVRTELEAHVERIADGALSSLTVRDAVNCEAGGPEKPFLIAGVGCNLAAADGFRASHPGGSFHFFQAAARCASCHRPEWAQQREAAVYVYRVLPDSAVAGIRIPMDYVAGTLLPQALAAVRKKSDPTWSATLAAARSDDEVAVAGGPMFPLMTITGRYQGTTIHSLARAHTRQSASMWSAALACLLAGVAFLMRAAAREARLAEMKSAFVSNMSHEMKTPLAMIRAFAETVELGRVQDPGRKLEYFRLIRKQSIHLTDMIDNVLEMARLESGHGEFRFEVTDVRGYEVSLSIDDPAPWANADARALAGVVMNLTSNAVKYSGGRGVEIRVFGRDRMACVAVADRGIGIAPAEQQRIFDKFYRVDSPLVHETKGTGLGLALARQVVEAHGGRIAVESRLGEGATFTVMLPAVEIAEAAYC
ncbi:MAG: HAMP domain-containing sensor histidine kinase [Bryobacteraceae bacterium]|nr:HAMP domain-containing sensor histidine kinase [Bryobacteraceae bacterium]